MGKDKKKIRLKRKDVAPATTLPKAIETMPLRELAYTVPRKADKKAMRRHFNTVRAEFLFDLARLRRKELLDAGFKEKEVDQMAQGRTPNGFNTHHKHPIGGGGTNDYANLVLINRHDHELIHKHQDPQLNDISKGQTRTILAAMPEGNVYHDKAHPPIYLPERQGGERVSNETAAWQARAAVHGAAR